MNQTKEIWRDFTRFAIISKPNIKITQNKNPVGANDIAYHIIVIFFKTDIQHSQKKCSFNDALLLTHAVLSLKDLICPILRTTLIFSHYFGLLSLAIDNQRHAFLTPLTMLTILSLFWLIVTQRHTFSCIEENINTHTILVTQRRTFSCIEDNVNTLTIFVLPRVDNLHLSCVTDNVDIIIHKDSNIPYIKNSVGIFSLFWPIDIHSLIFSWMSAGEGALHFFSGRVVRPRFSNGACELIFASEN